MNKALIRVIRRQAAKAAAGGAETPSKQTDSIDLEGSAHRESEVSGRPSKSISVSLPTLCSFKVCQHCDLVQPPRAYHCDVCQKCVLRGDHHCFWMGNCIGLHNIKSFTLYLFYLSSFTGYLVLAVTNCLTLSALDLVFLIFDWPNLIAATLLGFGLWLASICILAVHLKLVLSNHTTMELQKASRLGEKLSICKESPYYSKGSVLANLKDVFGVDKWYQTFIPTRVKEREYS